jgi:serine/threonine-protein kinase
MERIGEYLVRRLVGEGGMGKVYEAEERLSKRRVALKVLRPELARNEEGRRLFLNEMQILAHLAHPHIVRSLASMEIDDKLVLALEFVEGQTLRGALTDRGALSWSEAVDVVVQVAEALAAAHAQEPPVVHRDLKPENVMVDDKGNVKVMDFGIAKVLEAAHATNTQSIGTLQYMSPEQIDAKTIDARSDLYSLGLVFYELLVGTAPFRSASPRDLLNLQCTARPPELSDDVRRALPRGVEEVLFELLEKEPDARPQTAASVVERLAAFKPAAKNTTRAPSRPKPPAEPAPAIAPTAPSPRADTVALLAQASAPKQIPTRYAVAAIAALSLVAGSLTYYVRVHDASPSNRPTATADARR